MTARATWNGVVLAESDDTVIVEGNHYFPLDSVRQEVLSESQKHTTCPWKGEASYYNVAANGEVNPDAAWFYPEPFDAAKEIRDYVAFWHGVEVSTEDGDGRPGPTPPGR
jgi:uncharacterized protein (DUF427 family)